MNRREVRSGDAPTDSDNESGVTSETVREAVSSMGTDQSDGVTVRELLNALVEKDRVLTTLLERLTPSATPQPMSAGTPGGIAAFQDDGNCAAEERSDDEEPKLGLLYQPLELSGSRQRKKVERLDVSFRTAARERPPPEQGKGTPLGDCPRIEHNIKRERLESLNALHRLPFGRPGAPSEIKKNLRKFSGFPFEKDSAEYVKRQKMVAKLKKTAHKHLLGMLDLEKSGTVEECTDRILNFLLKPFDNKKPLPATKKRKSMTHASAGKGQAKKRKTVNPKAEKGEASRKRPAKKTSTPAKRRKVAKKEESDEDDESDEKEVRDDAHVSQLKAWPSTSKTSHLDDDEESNESEHQLEQKQRLQCKEPTSSMESVGQTNCITTNEPERGVVVNGGDDDDALLHARNTDYEGYGHAQLGLGTHSLRIRSSDRDRVPARA
ncbi:hypothetical protein HPB49_021353 [Dermacentor silvarum]|uniref:Uncharacterized protein n=1 Tax=Dermacentor silvarum TaxID=543639 RepID=A0ACB8DFG2_DERSI|nr:hypothetical protein HPB49_021353 [Dermacentor silvarum]